jgi:hypothetical protein
MIAGSFALWTAIPLAWIRLANLIAHARAAGYLIVLVGCPVTMFVWGRALVQLGLAYERMTGSDGERPALLEGIVVVSFLLAVVVFLVWFFVFAGSPSATPWPDELSGPGQ